MKVVSTSALPIDLAAQVTTAVPGTVVEVPAAGHVAIDRLELADADAVVCLLLDRIDAALLARAPRLRVVANCAVGYDNVDLAAATAAGVCVTNTPDVLTEATAELAFALLIACARRLGEGERLIRSGGWTGWALDQLLGVGLAGKTLGIIGYGRIGRALARRAIGFGMNVIYADPLAPESSTSNEGSNEQDSQVSAELAGAGPRGAARGGVNGPALPVQPPADGKIRPLSIDPQQRSVDSVFETADAISLHCPLTAETRHLVDARRLALMKPTAVLVNTARGGCIDDAALAAALRAGAIFGAALDVYAREPEIAAELLDCPRLVLAPHIGSATTEARTAMAQLCADAVIAALRGHRPPNLVNNVEPPWSRRS
ncbi:MAG TPA: D-glycerate dehydrogenase [Kofleriaceae bacterium]|nr:D-glycerate dehydrogenase [Kofleriaceae bacterium]